MALSGTLETFSLPELLRLLSTTNKTGALALDGDRGRGVVWVGDGAVVAADADGARFAGIDGVLFELLRFVDASFEFRSGEEAPDPAVEPCDVEEALATAEARLAEWREIEAVVPSLAVWVRMVSDVEHDTTVSPAQWRVLARIGNGVDGGELSERLEEDEYDVCRQLRDLVQAGLVELDEVPAERRTDPPARTDGFRFADDPAPEPVAPEPTFVEPALSSHEVSSLGADLASFVALGSPPEASEPAAELPTVEVPAEELLVPVEDLVAVEDPAPAEDPVPVEEPVPAEDLVPIDAPGPVDDAADDRDFLAQLAHLSPKAAAAIEATSGPDERGAEPAHPLDPPVAADPEPPTESSGDNLLLRFLSATDR